MDKEFEKTCDFFMIGKSEDLRQKSEKLFTFFIGFIEDVAKSMPKEEQKKKKTNAGGPNKANHLAMMEEMKAKMMKK